MKWISLLWKGFSKKVCIKCQESIFQLSEKFSIHLFIYSNLTKVVKIPLNSWKQSAFSGMPNAGCTEFRVYKFIRSEKRFYNRETNRAASCAICTLNIFQPPLAFFSTQINNFFLNLRISANHDNGKEFYPIVKSLYPCFSSVESLLRSAMYYFL